MLKMTIKLDITKSLEKNAGIYFEASKKAKKKLEGANAALERSLQKLEKAKKEQVKEVEKVKQKEVKKEWYEKFHWFISSEGFLCIGGRDAATNEIVIKKHTDKDDLVFHTQIAGSGFFVVKTDGKKVSESTLNETAQAVGSYSRAWKLGLSIQEVFYVNPEQVSKKAKPGEFIARGAFMIYGKKNILTVDLKLAVGIKAGKIIGGPVDAVKKNAEKFVLIIQGREKASAAAKKI
ncbi:unnamed protein product, partial [marine sediment metagenome]